MPNEFEAAGRVSGGEAGTSDGSGTAAPENTYWKLATLSEVPLPRMTGSRNPTWSSARSRSASHDRAAATVLTGGCEWNGWRRCDLSPDRNHDDGMSEGDGNQNRIHENTRTGERREKSGSRNSTRLTLTVS